MKTVDEDGNVKDSAVCGISLFDHRKINCRDEEINLKRA
jgi:hypothetical protein